MWVKSYQPNYFSICIYNIQVPPSSFCSPAIVVSFTAPIVPVPPATGTRWRVSLPHTCSLSFSSSHSSQPLHIFTDVATVATSITGCFCYSNRNIYKCIYSFVLAYFFSFLFTTLLAVGSGRSSVFICWFKPHWLTGHTYRKVSLATQQLGGSLGVGRTGTRTNTCIAFAIVILQYRHN